MRKRNFFVEFAAAFKALSNANRLVIFEIIRQGHAGVAVCKNENMPDDIPRDAVCVCEILEQMEITGPTLSHHLKELRNAGLVDVYHRGQWSYYSAREDVLDALSAYFRDDAHTGARRRSKT